MAATAKTSVPLSKKKKHYSRPANSVSIPIGDTPSDSVADDIARAQRAPHNLTAPRVSFRTVRPTVRIEGIAAPRPEGPGSSGAWASVHVIAAHAPLGWAVDHDAAGDGLGGSDISSATGGRSRAAIEDPESRSDRMPNRCRILSVSIAIAAAK